MRTSALAFALVATGCAATSPHVERDAAARAPFRVPVSITGRVVLDDGTPALGVDVEVRAHTIGAECQMDDFSPRAVASVSGSNGAFELSIDVDFNAAGKQVGVWIGTRSESLAAIAVRVERTDAPVQSFDVSTFDAGVKIAPFPNEGVRAHVVITMQLRWTLTGTLTDGAGGKPVAGVKVGLVRECGNTIVVDQTTSTADGRFAFRARSADYTCVRVGVAGTGVRWQVVGVDGPYPPGGTRALDAVAVQRTLTVRRRLAMVLEHPRRLHGYELRLEAAPRRRAPQPQGNDKYLIESLDFRIIPLDEDGTCVVEIDPERTYRGWFSVRGEYDGPNPKLADVFHYAEEHDTED